MWNGKRKAITFSYDDGVRQDIRLVELFNRYGLKATFNLNSGLFGSEARLVRNGVEIDHIRHCAADVKHIYEGHEVAAHTLTHPLLPALADDREIVRQVEEDRLRLSELVGYEVVGFAYPGGGINHNKRVADIIRQNTGVKYCRTTDSTHGFEPQADLFEFNPTVYHHVEMDEMLRLGEKFLEMSPQTPQIFYVWGHAYEFDIHGDWERFEEFCKMISGHSDIFYGTNREVLLGE
jgi:peptidoglycan/xylan/chitin deacetylase (PgdA/CDA1 family)